MAQRRWLKVLLGLFVAAGLLVWALAGSFMQLSSTMVCGPALQNLATTARIYASDLPTGPRVTSQDRIAALVQAGHLQPDQTVCPASKTPYILLPLPDPAVESDLRRVMAYETGANHGQPGGNVVYADGHAELLGEPKYSSEIAASRERVNAPEIDSSLGTPRPAASLSQPIPEWIRRKKPSQWGVYLRCMNPDLPFPTDDTNRPPMLRRDLDLNWSTSEMYLKSKDEPAGQTSPDIP